MFSSFPHLTFFTFAGLLSGGEGSISTTHQEHPPASLSLLDAPFFLLLFLLHQIENANGRLLPVLPSSASNSIEGTAPPAAPPVSGFLVSLLLRDLPVLLHLLPSLPAAATAPPLQSHRNGPDCGRPEWDRRGPQQPLVVDDNDNDNHNPMATEHSNGWTD